MTLRTFWIFSSLLLLCLLFVVSHALFGLGGPQAVIEQARHAHERGLPTEALKLLALAEPEVRNSPELRNSFLLLRKDIYLSIGDERKAVGDLGTLLDEVGYIDEKLELERVALMRSYGEQQNDPSIVQEALTKIEKHLAQAPVSGRALAIAGSLTQAILDIQLQDIRTNILSGIPKQAVEEAMIHLQHLVYRPQHDSRNELSRSQFLATLDPYMPMAPDRFRSEILELQDLAIKCKGYHRSSLVRKDRDFMAYQGMARILAMAGEEDAMQAIAEAYIRKADIAYAWRAALDLGKLHLKKKRYIACLAVLDKAIPAGQLLNLAEQGHLEPIINEYYLIKIIAHHHLDEASIGSQVKIADPRKRPHRKAMFGLAMEINRLPAQIKSQLKLFPLSHLSIGLGLRDFNNKSSFNHLRAYCNNINGWRKIQIAAEHAGLAYQMYLRVAEKKDDLENREAALEGIYNKWNIAERGSLRPALALADFYIKQNQSESAVKVLQESLNLQNRNEHLLRRFSDVSLIAALENGIELESVLERSIHLQRETPPELLDTPVLLLPFAEQALQVGKAELALNSAQLAAESFPWALWPRYLSIEAKLQLEETEEAVRNLKVMLESNPDESRAKALLHAIQRGSTKNNNSNFQLSLPSKEINLPTAHYLGKQWLQQGENEKVLAMVKHLTGKLGPDLTLQCLAIQAMQQSGKTKNLPVLLESAYQLAQSATKKETSQQAAWVLAQYILHNLGKMQGTAIAHLLDQYLNLEEDADSLVQIAAELESRGKYRSAYQAMQTLLQEDRFNTQRQGQHFLNAGKLALQLGHLETAQEMFAAAVSFDDGSHAAASLCILLLIQNYEDDAKLCFDGLKVDNLKTAFLAAYWQQNQQALPILEANVVANPNHLATLCALACMTKAEPSFVIAIPGLVQSLANLAGPNLLKLLALLQDRAFAEQAIQMAGQFKEMNPENPAAVLLYAKALSLAGKKSEVLAALQSVRSNILRVPCLGNQALEILCHSNNPQLEKSPLMARLLGSVMARGTRAPAAMMSMVVQHQPSHMGVPGYSKSLLPKLADFWMRYPYTAAVGMDQVDLLLQAKMYKPAYKVMQAMEPHLAPDMRRRFLNTYFGHATILAAEDPNQLPALRMDALRVISKEGAYGAVLHFLLASKEMEPLPTFTPAQKALQDKLEYKYLRDHIQLFLAGRDPNIQLLSLSLQRLYERDGKEQGLELIDQLLFKHPELIDVWVLRCKILADTGDADEIFASLEWINLYLGDGSEQDIILKLLARRGQLCRLGKNLIQEPDKLKAAPMTLGMVNLRLGQYQKAMGHFARAKKQIDGAHLFYAGLTYLHSKNKNSAILAQRKFAALARDYPQSSFADVAVTVESMLSF